jgi:hypothetical protein
MSKLIGTIVSSSIEPAIEREFIEVSTDEIEAFMRSRYSRGGWDVSFDWSSGQWPKMQVTRTREVVIRTNV